MAASAASWSSAAGATAGRAASRMLAMPGPAARGDQFGQPGDLRRGRPGARGGTDSRPICQARSASIRSPLSSRCIAAGLPTDGRQPLGAAESGHAADPRLGQPELAAVGGDDQVAGEHQLEAAAEGEPVDCGDDRHDRRRDAPSSSGVRRG